MRDIEGIRARTRLRHEKVHCDFNKLHKKTFNGMRPSIESVIEKVAKMNNLSYAYTERILSRK